MSDNALALNTRMNKSTITNAIKTFSNIGRDEIRNDNRTTEIKYDKSEIESKSYDFDNNYLDKYDIDIPKKGKRLERNTRKLSDLIIKPSDVEKGKKDEKFRKRYLNNVLNLNVVKTDVMAKPTVIMTRITLGQIHNITLFNLENTNSIITKINNFDIEVTNKFYNNTIDAFNLVDVKFNKINSSLSNHIRTNKATTKSNLLKEQFQSLIYVEDMFNLNDMKEKFMEVAKNLTLGMKYDVIKSFIGVSISSPISMAITGAVKKIIPEEIKDVFKSIDGLPALVSTALGLQFKKMKDSDNPLVSWIGNELIPNDSKRRNLYKQGVVHFDLFTKNAITKNIPTLLTYWLQAADPERYKDGLVYDYEKGRFVTGSGVQQYFAQFDYSKRITTLKEANKRRKLLKEESKNYDRFSINDVKFTKSLTEKYSHIYNGKADQEKYFESVTDEYSDKFKDKFKSKIKIKEGGLIDKFIKKVYKGLNIIDNYLFGSMDMEDAVTKSADKFFKFKDSNLVKQGKIVAKNVFGKIMDDIVFPITEATSKLLKEGKNVLSNLYNRAIKSLDEQVYPIIGQHLGKGFMSSLTKKVKDYFYEKIIEPIKKKTKDITNHTLEKISKGVKEVTRWVNEETQKIKANKKPINNFNNVLATVQNTANAEPANLSFFGTGANANNLLTPKSINISNLPVEKDTIVSIPIKNYGKSTKPAGIFIDKTTKDIYEFKDIYNKYTELITDAAIKDLEDNYKGEKFEAIRSSEEMRRIIQLEDSKVIVEGLSYLSKVDINYIKEHASTLHLWKVTQRINRSVTDRVMGGVGLALGKYGFRGVLHRANKAILKWSAKKITKTGINTLRHIVGMAGHAAKIYNFIKTFKVRATIKMLELGSKYLLPIMNEVLKKIGPSIIHLAGKMTRGLIHTAGFLAKKALDFVFKAANFALKVTGSILTSITGSGLKLINKLFHRTGSLADNSPRYIAHVIGGRLDSIEDPVQMEEIKTKIKYDDDEDEINKNKGLAKTAVGKIKGRISERMKFINNLINKALDKAFDFVTAGFTNVMSFILGGTVGTFIASQGGKATQDAESFGYENIFITGGSVNGGTAGDIANSIGDGIGDAIGDGVGDVVEKKGVIGKVTSFIGKHKKAAGILAAVATTLGVGTYIYKKNKEDNEEIQSTATVVDSATTYDSSQNNTPSTISQNNETVNPISDAPNTETNQSTASLKEETKSTATPVSNNNNAPSTAVKAQNNSTATKTDKTIANNITKRTNKNNKKSNVTKRNSNMIVKENIEPKEENKKPIVNTIVYNDPKVINIPTKKELQAQTTDTHNTKNSVKAINTNSHEKKVQSEIDNTINPYGTNTMSINTKISEPVKHKVDVDDMVTKYRSYGIEELEAEKRLQTRLNKRERSIYTAQDEMKYFSNCAVTENSVQTVTKKNGFLASIGKFFLSVAKGISGIISKGVKFVKNLITSGINMVKGIAKTIGTSITSATSGILKIGKTLLGSISKGLNKVKNKFKEIFGFKKESSNNSSSNTTNGGSSDTGSTAEPGGSGGEGTIDSNVSTAGYAWPVPQSSRISSGFGPRNISVPGASKDHKGIDISGNQKQDANGYKIVASKAGTVTHAGAGTGYGYYVKIDHGGGYETRYAHMNPKYIYVKKGDKVTQGQHIANIGNEGVSGGPHLHFEVRLNGTALNPTQFVSYGSNADRSLGKNNDTSTVLSVPSNLNKSYKIYNDIPEVIDAEGDANGNSEFKKASSKIVLEKDESTKYENCCSSSIIDPKKLKSTMPVNNITSDESTKSDKYDEKITMVKSNNVVNMDEYRQQKMINSKRVVSNIKRAKNENNDMEKYNQIVELLTKFNELMEEYSKKDKKVTIIDELLPNMQNSVTPNIEEDITENLRKIDDNVITILRGI